MALKSTTYLGIDGGGSRCRARIEDGNGSGSLWYVGCRAQLLPG